MSDNTPLPAGTFTSILPEVEDILEQIYGLLGDGAAVDKNTEAIVVKAKEIQSRLAGMKAAASSLPGGSLGADAVARLTEILEEQAERRRAVLQAFEATPTPTADELAQSSTP